MSPEGPEEPLNRGALQETVEAIDTYWFGFGSPTALGLFRIAIGFLSVVSLLMLAVDWDAWFSERGFVPAWLGARFVGSRETIGFGTNFTVPIIDLLSGATDDRLNLAFFAATVIVGVLTTLGLCTRISSILFALGLITLQHRNAAILHGGDSVVRLGCMYIAIAPSGRACSLDRLLGLWKGTISAVEVKVSVWPQRLIAANVALVYLTTLWLKWGGGAWRDGTATFYAAQLGEFKRFPTPAFMNEQPFVMITTYGTLIAEFALGTLVFFRPLRKYVLVAGILMHAQIEYSMNIPLFSFLMISTYICFYDGDEISAWAKRMGTRLARFHVDVQPPCGMKLRPTAARFFGAIDPFHLIRFSPGKSADWVARRLNGSSVSVLSALRFRCVGAWIFGWYPGIWNRILLSGIEPDAAIGESA